MKFILYTRKSTEQEERQTLSIEAQLRELREIAAKEQLEIVASLCEARTAREPGRTVFAEMLDMIEKGKADGILAWHPDRLARNSVDGGRIIYMLDTGKLKALRFPTFWFEPTPQGKFMLQIAFGQSKYYVDNLSENIKRGIRQKLHRGEWSWSAPLGYRNNARRKNIEPHPENGSIVRKAFELYATGSYTFKALRDELTKFGLRTRSSKKLAVASVQRMLSDPVYHGVMKINGELFTGSFEPLIGKTLFDEVQEVMRSRGKLRKGRKYDFPFTGWLRCAECGCAITAQVQKGHHYYHCTKKKGPCPRKGYLREEKLLDRVKAIVEQVSLPDDWAGKMLRQLDRDGAQEQTDNRAAIQHLEQAKQSTESKLSGLLDLKLEGVLDTAEYIAKKNQLINRKADVEQKIRDATQEQTNWIEPMREMILRSKQAKMLLHTEKFSEIPAFLKTTGSNWLLKGAAVRYEAKKGWRVLRQRRRFRTWWS